MKEFCSCSTILELIVLLVLLNCFGVELLWAYKGKMETEHVSAMKFHHILLQNLYEVIIESMSGLMQYVLYIF